MRYQPFLPWSRKALAAAVSVIATIDPSQAQVVADHNLASATIIERGACAVLQVTFYSRVQLHSHFPAQTGDELRLQLKMIDTPTPAPDSKTTITPDKPQKIAKSVSPRREQLRAPASDRAAINGLELENSGVDQTLSIYFRHAVHFKVKAGRDPRSVLVAIAGRTPNPACEPQIDEAARADAKPVPKAGTRAAGPLEADIAEARAAMGKADYDRAIAYLTRVTSAGATGLLPEALELLGIAREQKGHIAHARAEYQSYLRQFPTGSGHTRVAERLAALEKRELARTQAPPPPASPVAANGTAPPGTQLVTTPSASQGVDRLAPRRDGPGGLPATAPPPDAWQLRYTGSISAYYNLNQGGRDFFVRPNLQQGWDKENVFRTYRNSLLSIGDYEGIASNAFYSAGMRISGSQEQRFNDGGDDWRISTLSFEGKHKETGTSFKLGRQTHYGGGILGRFDGAIAAVPLADAWKLRVYAGSPVELSGDSPFQFDRAFYGASVDYAVRKGLDIGAYVIEQTADRFTDRRAVGSEVRYVDDWRHGFAAVDYDVHFGELNSALGTGTLMFADRSSFTATFDYRRSPILFARNALQGQFVTSLRDMLRIYSVNEIEDLARDRTPKSVVASFAYTQYLSDRLQITTDTTITNMSAMPESGGVAWAPSTGWDTYMMVQLLATDVLRESDQVTAAVRYAATQSANRSLIEGSVKLPLADQNWRVGPMLRLGYSEYKLEPAHDYILHPMLRASYNWSRDLQIELEAGHRWTLREGTRGGETETELLLLTGVRYQFYSER